MGKIMLGRPGMKIIENFLIGAVLSAIFPILGFLAGWWGTFTFMPDRLIFLMASAGLLIGIMVDVVFLKRWVGSAYSINLKIWMAVYLFYSIGMLGFFMGVPVFNLLLAVPAGLFIGSKLAHQRADYNEVRRMSRNTCIFTTGVLAAVCVTSAVIAWVDPYTSLNLQGMLGLQFEVTRWMLAGVIVVGGIALLCLQWGITGQVIRLTHAFMQTNVSAVHCANNEV
jgi:hypothetical protein